MRIVHIAPNAPYNDYWGYQENLLPKYQAKLGHSVIIITTNQMHREGRIVDTEESEYQLTDGVKVIRRKRKQYLFRVATNLCARISVEELLKELHPDFIFFHGLVSTTIFEAIAYKKKVNPSCIIVQDNHMDYYNSRKFSDVHGKIMRMFYRLIASRSIQNVARVYGVTPWRQQYAIDYFKLPADKTDILIMGADDEKIHFERRNEIRKEIRDQYHIAEKEFLIVTGGKINESKKTHILMEAVNRIENVKLIVFGEIESNVQEQIDKQRSNKNILIGWIPAEKTYDYYLAADLVCFPGTHSVMWEQACACKVPCLFAQWTGMDHVNNGGNSEFINNITVEGLRSKIEELRFTEKYYDMKKNAESHKTDIYLYSAIAKKSLEMSKKKPQ